MNDLGLCLSYAGEAKEGVRLAQKAMRMNPHYPEFYTMQIGQIYFDARLYELAVAGFGEPARRRHGLGLSVSGSQPRGAEPYR